MAEAMTGPDRGIDLADLQGRVRRLLADLPPGWGYTLVAFAGSESWSLSEGDPITELQALDALVQVRWRTLKTRLEP